jgi:hypothetical protein
MKKSGVWFLKQARNGVCAGENGKN